MDAGPPAEGTAAPREVWRVLFVCSGNICRSPMAEGLLRSYAEARQRGVEVQSAGTLGIRNAPADPYAVAVCAEIGVDLGAHRSQALTQELVSWADYILVMEYAHAAAVRGMNPDLGEKVLLLGGFGRAMEIADPIGGWKFQFRWSRDEIKVAVEMFLDRLPTKLKAGG